MLGAEKTRVALIFVSLVVYNVTGASFSWIDQNLDMRSAGQLLELVLFPL